MIRLLFGDQPRAGDVLAAAIVAIAAAALVAIRIQHWDWQAVLLLLLAADIGAGLVSNATRATRSAWRQLTGRTAKALFIIVHLGLYPLALFLLTRGDIALFGILAALLLAKTALFISGQSGPRPRE